MTKTNILSFLIAAGLAATSSAAVTTSVVYGNLGVNEDAGIGSTSTTISATTLRAQGFTTGDSAAPLTLQTIKLGLSADSATNVAVSVFSDNGNKPGTLLFTSSVVSVSSSAVYSFAFSGADLDATTNYWISPVGSNVRWYINLDETAPDALNASGYAFLGTKASANGGTSWSNSALPYSVSITAVPEPSSALIGALGVLAMVRRRR